MSLWDEGQEMKRINISLMRSSTLQQKNGFLNNDNYLHINVMPGPYLCNFFFFIFFILMALLIKINLASSSCLSTSFTGLHRFLLLLIDKLNKQTVWVNSYLYKVRFMCYRYMYSVDQDKDLCRKKMLFWYNKYSDIKF